ncbi:uncharacterized protein LOC134338873 [Mobula hypostoma]|uniref:uncharacterized protein LOC134338873 n=1 Tax=Mobula hypostoma TaxID=723540 RepID=UPI002FC2BC0F
MDIVYLDFHETFDNVLQMRLLNKMRACDITGSWKELGIKGAFVGWLPVTSGVPQRWSRGSQQSGPSRSHPSRGGCIRVLGTVEDPNRFAASAEFLLFATVTDGILLTLGAGQRNPTHPDTVMMVCLLTVKESQLRLVCFAVRMSRQSMIHCSPKYGTTHQSQTHPHRYRTPVLYSDRPVPTGTVPRLHRQTRPHRYRTPVLYSDRPLPTGTVPRCYTATDPSPPVPYPGVTVTDPSPPVPYPGVTQ